ncbi:MAG: DUF4139 domain-containing protein [Planctomycetota bacterium]|nr:MAG: DUF4139 domain-containing protein [Planctomycetota bacterium]
MKRLCGLAIIFSAAATVAADERVDLKVTRVALFSSGVGYFEREATVDGNASAELSFRVEQINDIIKSLIVQDFDGGRIGAVSYASQDPIEKRLRSFGVDITGKPTLAELLDQLRGQRVEIKGERSARGVIVGVESRKTQVGESILSEDVLNVLTDSGIEQFALSRVDGIRLTDDAVNKELQGALATLATGADSSKKSVVIRFDGQGRRRVRAAYLLEAPIWKTSYRLVLDEEKPPFLQGWATVENATEEDWRDVRLSLVSGRPISFRMDLYTPIYIPRPLEELELYASLRPPEFEGALEAKSARDARGRVGRMLRPAAPPPPRQGGLAIQSLGYAGESIDDADRMAGSTLSLENSGVASVATAADAGELFEYTIQDPVSIPRQNSAMLPIVNQAIEGTKVSIFNPRTHQKHPLNGLELKNTSDLNLMQGPVTLFDGNVYAGDAKLPDLQPGEKRLIAYALDLTTEIKMRMSSRPTQTVSLRAVKGVLIETNKYVDERTYIVKNKGDRPRTVLIEQPYSDDWKLIEPPEPYERTASLSRFKVEAPAGKTVEQRVKLESVTDQRIALTNLPTDRIQIYLRSRVISDQLKNALSRAIEMRMALEQVRANLAAAEKAYEEAVKEQARIRDNLRSLQRDSDAYRRQMSKFDEYETEIERHRKRIGELRGEESSQSAALDAYLANLTVE